MFQHQKYTITKLKAIYLLFQNKIVFVHSFIIRHTKSVQNNIKIIVLYVNS